MYIEFSLTPELETIGHPALKETYTTVLYRDIKDWATRHDVRYKTKLWKMTYRLILENEQAYTHFQLSWDPVFKGHQYRLVEPGQIPPDKLTSSPD
jgi:hypothetical protein